MLRYYVTVYILKLQLAELRVLVLIRESPIELRGAFRYKEWVIVYKLTEYVRVALNVFTFALLVSQ